MKNYDETRLKSLERLRHSHRIRNAKEHKGILSIQIYFFTLNKWTIKKARNSKECKGLQRFAILRNGKERKGALRNAKELKKLRDSKKSMIFCISEQKADNTKSDPKKAALR